MNNLSQFGQQELTQEDALSIDGGKATTIPIPLIIAGPIILTLVAVSLLNNN